MHGWALRVQQGTTGLHARAAGDDRSGHPALRGADRSPLPVHALYHPLPTVPTQAASWADLSYRASPLWRCCCSPPLGTWGKTR